MKNPRFLGLRRFRRFCQLAAVGAAFCLGLLAESALAGPVWFQFYRISDQGHGFGSRGPLHHITGGKEAVTRGGVTVTVQSFRPDTTDDPSRQLVIRTFSYGGYGVRRAGEPRGGNPEGFKAGAVGRGESLFLSFDREVTLLAAVHFDTRRGLRGFRGRGAGHFYKVWRLSDDGRVKVGSVDPLGPAYEGEGAPEPSGSVPIGGEDGEQQQVSPVLAQFVPVAGQTLHGTQFELRVPNAADAAEFRWFLSGLLVQACPDDHPPIPEPSTALLVAAGLAALGWAGVGRRA